MKAIGQVLSAPLNILRPCEEHRLRNSLAHDYRLAADDRHAAHAHAQGVLPPAPTALPTLEATLTATESLTPTASITTTTPLTLTTTPKP